MTFDDRFAETEVCLLVKFEKGQWTLNNGSPLPKIREGVGAELVLSASAIVDDNVRKILTEERQVPFLEKGTRLWARVDGKEVPEKLCEAVSYLPCWPPQDGGSFVEIILQEDLFLTLRANKNARLTDCTCRIPSLPNLEAKSVNHAYTLISNMFEPKRRSHAGNVFQKVYYSGKLYGKDYLRALNDKRMEVEAACASDKVHEGKQKSDSTTKDTMQVEDLF